MQAAGRLNDATNLAGVEGKSGILKLLLHVATAKVAEVAALPGAGAVALRKSELSERGGARLDALLVAADDGGGVVLGAGNVGLAPGRGPARVAVLDEQVGGADLALGGVGQGALARGGVVSGHIVLEAVGVGALRRLPARDLVDGVEVVGQVLGVGVANLPVGGEPGFRRVGLRCG
jgi:hypothetical protein